MTQCEEVLDHSAVAILLGHARALRLVDAEPFDGLLEPIQCVVRVQRGIADDPEARAAGAERNQPHPIAHAHQMIGAVPARLVGHAGRPRPVGNPVVEPHTALDAPPARVGQVRDLAGQPQAAAHQAGAAAGVDEPARRDGARPVGRIELDAVMRITELEVLDRGAIEHADAVRPVRVEQPVFQPAAIELEGGDGREHRRPQLETGAEVAVVAGREEVAQSKLFQVAGA